MGWIDNRDIRDKGYEGELVKESLNKNIGVDSKEKAMKIMKKILEVDLAEFETRIEIYIDKCVRIKKRLKEF